MQKLRLILLTLLFSTTCMSDNYIVDTIWLQPLVFPSSISSDSNAVWDFSNNENQDMPVELLEYSIAQDSTQVIKSYLHKHQYFTVSENTLFLLEEETYNNKSVFADSIEILRIPIGISNQTLDSFACVGSYGHHISYNYQGISNTKINCGVLNLPNGFSATALHVCSTRGIPILDSVKIHSVLHQWYIKNYSYPIVEMFETYSGDSTEQHYAYYHIPDMAYSTDANNNVLTIDGSQVQNSDSIITNINFAPNPVVDDLYVSYDLLENANVYISVHYEGGMSLYLSPTYKQEAGTHQVVIPMHNMPTATYVLYIHADDHIVSGTIIKI